MALTLPHPFAVWLQRSVLMVALVCAACSGGSGGPDNQANPYEPQGSLSGDAIWSILEHTGGATTPSEYRILATHHPQGVSLIVRAYLPGGSKLSDAGDSFPVVFGYHGSGGLLQGISPGTDCTKNLETKYQEMTDFLLEKGIAVIWIDSFTSRGPKFCEDKNDYQPYGPPYMDNLLRQVVSRLYDTISAEKTLCQLARIDCNRMARIGTSEGGTAVLLPTHRFLKDSVDRLFLDAENNKLAELQPGPDTAQNVPYWSIPAERPQPQFVMAISPGCGFRSAIPLTLAGSPLPRDLFFPAQPAYLEIGTADDNNVPDECVNITDADSQQWAGRRQLQVNKVASEESIPSKYFPVLRDGGPHELWLSTFKTDIQNRLTDLINTHLAP